jgi:hypothetical protein
VAGHGPLPGERPGTAPPAWRREIRSARFPHGLPDRCDLTVIEAFDDAWLLLERTCDGYRIVGVAGDYAEARVWLTEDGGREDG